MAMGRNAEVSRPFKMITIYTARFTRIENLIIIIFYLLDSVLFAFKIAPSTSKNSETNTLIHHCVQYTNMCCRMSYLRFFFSFAVTFASGLFAFHYVIYVSSITAGVALINATGVIFSDVYFTINHS